MCSVGSCLELRRYEQEHTHEISAVVERGSMNASQTYENLRIGWGGGGNTRQVLLVRFYYRPYVYFSRVILFPYWKYISRARQSISRVLFVDSVVDSLELAGNVLDKSDLMGMEGVDSFLARREKSKNKSLQGGGMLDLSVCGLD